MKLFLAAMVITTMLTGCSTTNGAVPKMSNGVPITETLVLSKCPALKKYSKEQLEQAATELAATQSDSQLAKMVIDYGQLREACRAIQNKLKK